MNRTLKFRVWDNNKKSFNYIDLYKDNFNAGKYLDPIIHQFTGLTDSAGNEIYEGDFIKYNTDTFFGVVKYEIDKFIVESVKPTFSIISKADLLQFLELETENIKKLVIGNSIENNNLLNEIK